MIGDLERLQVILQDLGAAVDGPNQLPESLQEFVEVGYFSGPHMTLYQCPPQGIWWLHKCIQ